jgi:hypothetical protein
MAPQLDETRGGEVLQLRARRFLEGGDETINDLTIWESSQARAVVRQLTRSESSLTVRLEFIRGADTAPAEWDAAAGEAMPFREAMPEEVRRVFSSGPTRHDGIQVHLVAADGTLSSPVTRGDASGGDQVFVNLSFEQVGDANRLVVTWPRIGITECVVLIA